MTADPRLTKAAARACRPSSESGAPGDAPSSDGRAIERDVHHGGWDPDASPSLPRALALAIRLAVQRRAQSRPDDPTMLTMQGTEEVAGDAA